MCCIPVPLDFRDQLNVVLKVEVEKSAHNESLFEALPNRKCLKLYEFVL
jgi:hypothetical protein